MPATSAVRASRIDRDHAVEPADVETGCVGGRARAEQVGRLLRQPHRSTGRDGGVRRPQALHRLRHASPERTSPGSHDATPRYRRSVSASRAPGGRCRDGCRGGPAGRCSRLAASSSRPARISAWTRVSSKISRWACEPPSLPDVGLEPKQRVGGSVARSPSTYAARPECEVGQRRRGAGQPRRNAALCANRRSPSASPAVASASAACAPRKVKGTPSSSGVASEVAHARPTPGRWPAGRGRAAGSARAATARRSVGRPASAPPQSGRSAPGHPRRRRPRDGGGPSARRGGP